MQKDFESWSNLKKEINSINKIPEFCQSDIWWCNMGLNIGDEQDGKGESFVRPVLVFRKFNKKIFLGLPLSTTQKDNFFYHPIFFNNRKGSVILSQIKLLSAKRLRNKMGKFSKDRFEEIERRIKQIL